MADIKAMLSRSPMAKIQACEEWAIHSDEGFKGITIGEYESIDRVVELAQKLKRTRRSIRGIFGSLQL